MFNNLSKNYKKAIMKECFITLPALLLVAGPIVYLIIKYLNIDIDLIGSIFVVLFVIFVYIMCVMRFYRDLAAKNNENGAPSNK